MTEAIVLLRNETVLPDTLRCIMISGEKDIPQVQESSWKVMSNSQQGDLIVNRSPSFPP